MKKKKMKKKKEKKKCSFRWYENRRKYRLHYTSTSSLFNVADSNPR